MRTPKNQRFVIGVMLAMLAVATPALASDAWTSASATNNRGRPGTATATAGYTGDQGFARTQTRSGGFTLSRAVAVGVDEDGLSISVSNALAPRNGPAIATTFNLSIDLDGGVSRSGGAAVAVGGIDRSVSAAGRAAAPRGAPIAIAAAGGRTSWGGGVRSNVHSGQELPAVRRVIRLP